MDPEPWILFTPRLARDDPRLLGQVYEWCGSHADRISASRLRSLLPHVPESTRKSFVRFAAGLARDRGVRWPTDDSVAPPPAPPPVSSTEIPFDRPALLHFRMRALSGVGARAGVLCGLLARSGQRTTAAQLAAAGYSKRHVAMILSELSAAGIVRSTHEGNKLAYSLARPEVFRALIDGATLAHPEWQGVLELVDRVLALAALSDSSHGVRRVEAQKARDELDPLAGRLWLPSPPKTRGVATAWGDLLEWGNHVVTALADGSSRAFDAGAGRSLRSRGLLERGHIHE